MEYPKQVVETKFGPMTFELHSTTSGVAYSENGQDIIVNRIPMRARYDFVVRTDGRVWYAPGCAGYNLRRTDRDGFSNEAVSSNASSKVSDEVFRIATEMLSKPDMTSAAHDAAIASELASTRREILALHEKLADAQSREADLMAMAANPVPFCKDADTRYNGKPCRLPQGHKHPKHYDGGR